MSHLPKRSARRGSAEAASRVTLLVDGVPSGSTIATGGAYSITAPVLAGGGHTIAVTATDAAGNVSAASGGTAITIDTTPPTVVSVQADGPQLRLTMSEPLIAADAQSASNYRLTGAGPDGALGTADDVNFPLTAQYTPGGTQIILNASGGTLPQGDYQLVVNGSAANGSRDLAGNVLDGDANGTPGGDFVRALTISLPVLATVTGTGGSDVISLVRDGDGRHVDWSLNGGPLQTLSINDPGGLTINGDLGVDAITLNYAAGDPLPGILHLNGTYVLNGLPATGDPLAGHTLDIAKSTILVSYTTGSDPRNLLKGYLQNGYHTGAWTGTATAGAGVITSSAAAADLTHGTTIGYADSASSAGAVALPPGVANAVELKYTWTGDINLDGVVNFGDLLSLAQNYTKSAAVWTQGDLNYDGSVNFSDLLLLAQNYGRSVVATAAPASLASQVVKTRPRIKR